MQVDVVFHFEDRQVLHLILSRLDQVLAKLIALEQREVHMVQEIDDLILQVSRNTDVESSALAVLNGIVPRIQAAIDAALAAGATPAVLAAIINEKNRLSTSAEALAAAVVANTTPPPPSRR